MKEIRDLLFSLQETDPKFKAFQHKLIPTVDEEDIIGIRTPDMKKLVSTLSKEGFGADSICSQFLSELPHRYFDEYNLHVMLLGRIKDYDRAIKETDRILPYINNWATCDVFSPTVFKKHRKELLEYIPVWLASTHTYTIRFGIEMLMSHFLDEDFNPMILQLVSSIRSEEYYVNMMIAWFMATALAKQYSYTIPYIENGSLAPWLQNKTIQKSVESYRISDDKKNYLRTLKNAKK
jgi:3-methyladenine DNA glycosylase AlkD